MCGVANPSVTRSVIHFVSRKLAEQKSLGLRSTVLSHAQPAQRTQYISDRIMPRSQSAFSESEHAPQHRFWFCSQRFLVIMDSKVVYLIRDHPALFVGKRPRSLDALIC